MRKLKVYCSAQDGSCSGQCCINNGEVCKDLVLTLAKQARTEEGSETMITDKERLSEKEK
jgi:hypothetical protein